MAELVLERAPWGLKPIDEHSRTKLGAWSVGEVVRVKATKMRNGRNHNRFFKLLDVCVENYPEPITVEALLYMIKVRCGHVEPFIDPKTGQTYLLPKSISFASMDEPEFRAWYSAASRIICSEFLRCDESEFFQYVNLM